MRILAAKILVPQIIVRVELDQRNGAVLFCNGAQNRQTDRVIAPYANAPHTSSQKRSDSLLDTKKRVLDGKRIHGEIPKVRDAKLGEGIHLQNRVPRPDDRGLRANMTRPKARAGPISCASIEGNADESDLELLVLGDVRQAHEGGYAGETGMAQSVERLGMRQTKGAAGFKHGEAS